MKDGVIAGQPPADLVEGGRTGVSDTIDPRWFGAFPDPAGDALREALRAYARTFQHGEKVWPREFVENALAYALTTKETQKNPPHP